MAGIELAMIDGATDHASFANHLRWNNAYHRLAQRL
jgi:L-arabinose isomerase